MTSVPPRRVGLTGGIGSGKSYCLARFADLGVPVIDADVLAREVVAPGTAGFDAVVDRFGAGVVGPDGALDRAALGRVVFNDIDARRALEAIIHPAVYAAIDEWFAKKTSEVFSFVIADVPLLYETNRDVDFDAVIVTSCRPAQQLERLLARGGLSEAEARQRIDAQLPLAEKARRADFVIDTSGEKADTDRQVVEVFERLRAVQGDVQADGSPRPPGCS